MDVHTPLLSTALIAFHITCIFSRDPRNVSPDVCELLFLRDDVGNADMYRK
jgi:hypothetical protein